MILFVAGSIFIYVYKYIYIYMFVTITAIPLPSAFDQRYPRLESNLSNIIKDMNALYKELTDIQSDMIAGNKRERLGQGKKPFISLHQQRIYIPYHARFSALAVM